MDFLKIAMGFSKSRSKFKKSTHNFLNRRLKIRKSRLFFANRDRHNCKIMCVFLIEFDFSQKKCVTILKIEMDFWDLTSVFQNRDQIQKSAHNFINHRCKFENRGQNSKSASSFWKWRWIFEIRKLRWIFENRDETSKIAICQTCLLALDSRPINYSLMKSVDFWKPTSAFQNRDHKFKCRHTIF